MLVGVARHRARSVQVRLASTNALAISGKRREPGFPDAEPFYTFTAPPRIFFGLTILIVTVTQLTPIADMIVSIQ
jgi:hypothetical protein